MLKRIALSAVAVLIAWSCVACGPPSLGEIEKHLNNPSAELKPQLIALGFKSYDRGDVAVNMPSMGKHGKMISYLKVADGRKKAIVPMKDYLVQSGVPSGIAQRLMPYLPVNNDFTFRKKYVEQGELGTLKQALPLDKCIDGSVGILNGSFSISVDLNCAGEGSGRIRIVAAAEGGWGGAAQGLFRMSIHFQNACNTRGDCIDGSMVYKVGSSVREFKVNGSEVKLMLSMDLNMKDSSGNKVRVKQGIRVSYALSKGQAGTVEVLTYIRDEEGKEHTLVLEFSASAKRGTFYVRGANGRRYSCHTSNRGLTGRCYMSGKHKQEMCKW